MGCLLLSSLYPVRSPIPDPWQSDIPSHSAEIRDTHDIPIDSLVMIQAVLIFNNHGTLLASPNHPPLHESETDRL